MTLSLLALLADPAKLPKSAPSDSFWLPTDASVTTRNIDWVWDFMVWMSVLTALAIFVAMFHFVTKYRAKSRAANELAEKRAEHNTALEITNPATSKAAVATSFDEVAASVSHVSAQRGG